MSALKLTQNCKYKEIIIKNTLKSPNYEYKPQFNPTSSFIRNRTLQTKQKMKNPTHNGSLSSHNHSNSTSFNNDIRYRTFRASSNKMLNDSKKQQKIIPNNFNFGNNDSIINNEYYFLPIVNQIKYSRVSNSNNKLRNNRQNLSNSKKKNENNSSFLKLNGNSSRQIHLLNYKSNNNSLNTSNHSIRSSHVKSQSISYENGLNYIQKLNNSHNMQNSKEEKHHNTIYKSILTKYSCKSKPGYSMNGTIKTNQDSFLSKNKIFGLNNYSIFGVFDGHGVNGHFISRFLKEHFGNFFCKKENYLSHNENDSQLTEKKCYERLSNYYFFKQACISADEKIKKLKIDSKLSGSTGVIIAHIEDKILCFNIGDSRAIYINEFFEPVQISKDHKPNLPEEQTRIQNRGGRVSRLQNFANMGPFRVWVRNDDVPGLAMSRSFGDFIAKSVGVICEPDFFEINLLEKKVRSVIIASDGLYEFLSNEVISSLISPYLKSNDCGGAVKKLTEEAFRAWTKDGVICDDITIIVLFFKYE